MSAVPFELLPNIIKKCVCFSVLYWEKKWDLIGWSTKLSYLSTMLSQIPKLSWWWHNSLTIIIQRFFGVYGQYRQTLFSNKGIMPDKILFTKYGRFFFHFEQLLELSYLHLTNSKAFLYNVDTRHFHKTKTSYFGRV